VQPEQDDFADTLPKAEIHLHLEGSVDLDTLLRLGDGAGPGGEAARRRFAALYEHHDFRHFLENYRAVCGEIRRPRDFALITEALCARLRTENVRYAEVMCSPMIFTRAGLPVLDIMDAVSGVARDVEAAGGPHLRFLFDGVRQWGAGALEELVEMAVVCRAYGVIGIGIGGDERSVPTADFAPVYREARRLGLHTVAHAGEFAGPRSVWEVMEVLEAQRIGHGIRAAEDATLMAALARYRIPLECCPTSNIKTGVVPSWREHPIPALLEAGVRVTVNSDDPALFGTTIAGEWRALESRLGLARDAVLRIGLETAEAAFLDAPARRDLTDAMRHAAAAFGVEP
jgi:aminodeoxyfutalosine deaminase